MDELLPAGATEQHLIEELTSVIWRKRRVLQAEGATINQGLKVSARNAKSIILTAAPYKMGLSGEGTDIRNLLDLKPEDVTERHQNAREVQKPPENKSIFYQALRFCKPSVNTFSPHLLKRRVLFINY